MKIQEKCLPCVVNQAIKVADIVGLQEKEGLLKKVFAYLSEVDYQSTTNSELTGEIFSLLKKETGNMDPYRETRQKYNTMFLEQLEAFEQEIDSDENLFLMAIKYAIMGNIIDFNPIHNFLLQDMQNSFLNLKEEQLAIDDSSTLIKEIKQAKSILYLGDNCGEICLDKILIKKIKVLNPSCHIFLEPEEKR